MKKIPFSVFSLDGLYRLASSIVAEIKKLSIEDADFTKLVALAEKNLKHLEAVMLKTTTKVHTNTIFKLDQFFDNSFKALKSFIQSCMYLPQKEKQKAAAILWELIRKHGAALYRLGYTKQISRAQNLFAEIERDPRNQQAIKTIGAEVLFTQMQTCLNDLIEGIEQRNQFIASQPEGTSSDAEKGLVENLKNTCAYVQIKSAITEPGVWQKLENQLDVIIDESVRIARLSQTREEQPESETTV